MAFDKEHMKPANTFIDKGITVRADMLSGAESVRIDGLYIGGIELGGFLQVGQTGRIEGNMQVTYALIAGQVLGNITCQSTLQLAPTAIVTGNISAGSVIVDDGAVFSGFCETRVPERNLLFDSKENKK
jgi:cytoskeletal protein CcmA (bactofilin family)